MVISVVNAVKTNAMKANAFYWFVVIASSCLLLSGWAIAVKNLILGQTVQ